MYIAKTSNYDFLKYRYIVACYTVLVFVGALGLYAYHYRTRGSGFSYGVEFTGGTQVLVRSSDPINSSVVRAALEKQGWRGPVTREFSDNELLIRVGEYVNDSQGLGEKIRSIIAQEYPESTLTILESESVGPGVGAELRSKSMRAVVIALIAMLIYIALTFWSWSYALGAVVALFHDAFIMLAFFLMLDRDITMAFISAVLAVLGYSINDTIIIFSYIRENRKKMPEKPLYDVINISINQSLRRTLLTSFSTTLAVGSMLIFGGEAIRDFCSALLVGIIFGTYSSIFMASPVMMMVSKEK